MKRLIIFLTICILISMSAFSQTVKLIEMVTIVAKSECHNFSCCSEFITPKGFSYYHSNKGEIGTSYQFSSDSKFPCTSNPSVSTKNQFIFTLEPNGKLAVNFSTPVKPHYQKMMSELDSLKFKEIHTFDYPNGVISTIYLSSNYPGIRISVGTMIIDHETLGGWTSYDFGISFP